MMKIIKFNSEEVVDVLMSMHGLKKEDWFQIIVILDEEEIVIHEQ